VSAPAWSRRGLVLMAVGLVVLAVVQVSLVDLLPTPWAVPDLVVVAVLALAIARGPLTGGLAGAGAGLILDLIPPASGPLGGWMLVLGLAGAVLGRVAETYAPGPFAAMLLLAIAAGAVVLARAAVIWFAGSSVDVVVLGAAVASAAWALLLAPLALLLVTRSTRPAPQAPVGGRQTGPMGSGGAVGAP
jgi:cell shape-determining protein MreD